MKISTTISKSLYYVVGIVFILLFWVILSEVKNNNIVFPKVDVVFLEFISLFSDTELLIDTLSSLFRVIIVVFIALIISLVITFLYLIKKDTLLLFKPLLVLLKSAPLAIISIYLWISLGADAAPHLITLLMVLPVTIEGFIAAVDGIDKAYINQLKTEDVPLIKKYFKIYIPLIMPYIIMTLLQTFGMGLKVMLMGEFICQTSNSLGENIYFYKNDLMYDKLLALLLLIVIIVDIIELIIKLISIKLDKTNISN